ALCAAPSTLTCQRATRFSGVWPVSPILGGVFSEPRAVATFSVFGARLPNADRPYRCWGYPVVPAVYVAILAAVAVNTLLTQRTEAAAGVGFIALGALVYAVALRGPREPG